MKYVFVSLILAFAVSFGVVCTSFADSGRNLNIVDDALLDGLQGLKESMLSVESSVDALRLENDFYRHSIHLMKEALEQDNRQQPAEPQENSAQTSGLKEKDLIKNRLAGKIEEYRVLADEHADLLRRIEAKEKSADEMRRRAAASGAQADALREQIALLSDSSDKEFKRQIENLETMFVESRDDLALQEQHKQSFQIQQDMVPALVAAEAANKELWIRMQNFEAGLREFSAQSVEAREDSAKERKNREDQILNLEREIQNMDGQLRSLREEIDESPSPEIVFAEDRSLREYYKRLQEENRILRGRVASLRDALPDL